MSPEMSTPCGDGHRLPPGFRSSPQPSARCCHATRFSNSPTWALVMVDGYSARNCTSVGRRLVCAINGAAESHTATPIRIRFTIDLHAPRAHDAESLVGADLAVLAETPLSMSCRL